jgi:hypothetical protein
VGREQRESKTNKERKKSRNSQNRITMYRSRFELAKRVSHYFKRYLAARRKFDGEIESYEGDDILSVWKRKLKF